MGCPRLDRLGKSAAISGKAASPRLARRHDQYAPAAAKFKAATARYCCIFLTWFHASFRRSI
jgi:hypothetical protein